MPIDVSDLDIPGLTDLPGYADGCVPGPQLAALLDGIDPAALPTDHDVLDYVAATERATSWMQSLGFVGTAEFVRRPEYVGPDPAVPLARRVPRGEVAREFAGLEMAARLAVSSRSADLRVDLAVRLAAVLAPTAQALATGRIDVTKARVVAAETADLDARESAVVQGAVLGRAKGQTPTQLRRSLRRRVLSLGPAAVAARCARSRADRWVRIWADGDDMAMLQARLPAETAAALDAALAAAAGAPRDPADGRTVDQRHADALTDLLLGDGSGIRAEVHVTVPATVLLGVSEAPAELAGHGPVSADLARFISVDATWRRILTDPLTGAVVDLGTTGYRPGVVLARHVRTRDGHCVGPSCSRPAHRCDLDHTVAWPVGPTVAGNLGPLCRRQHRFKQHPTVHLEQTPPGEFVWTYPTGHRYRVGPEPADDSGPPATQGDPGG